MDKIIRKPAEDIYPQKIFAHQLITVDDLNEFRQKLLNELLAVLKTQTTTVPKKWLKSHEVRRLLKISPGTLQTFKSSGIIPHAKIGGIIFYDHEDILRLLETGHAGSIHKVSL